jgi:lactate dehydrogenase-like 2-hydroxyacid dehydrogenase
MMKQGVMLINTSRGALIDANAAIEAIKTGKIGYLAMEFMNRSKNCSLTTYRKI